MHKTERLLADAEISTEFDDEYQHELALQAILGKDVEDWMRGPVGRFVLGAAVQDQRAIEQKLVSINPNTFFRRRKLAELQQEHRAIGKALEWLRDAVVIGESAHRELNELATPDV